MEEEISACFGPLPRLMGRSYSTPFPLGARWCVLPASSVWGAGPVAKRAREARVELRIVSKYLNKCVKETKRKNRNQETKRGRKRQSGREKLVKERCTSLTSRGSCRCLKKSEANHDYGICSFTGSSSGRERK